jgi:hypothetical protein
MLTRWDNPLDPTDASRPYTNLNAARVSAVSVSVTKVNVATAMMPHVAPLALAASRDAALRAFLSLFFRFFTMPPYDATLRAVKRRVLSSFAPSSVVPSHGVLFVTMGACL